MRKLLAGATFLVFGAGAMSSASAQLQMKGSDTLEDVTKGVLADCIVSTNDPTVLATTDITYVGGGSGGGEGAVIGAQQRIAPMSRPFKNGAVGTVNPCPVTAPATQGVLDTRGEQLLIGLDGIAVVAANQTHADSLFDDHAGLVFNCADSIIGVTLTPAQITPAGTAVGTPGAGGCPADPALCGAPNCCLDAAGNNFGCDATGAYQFSSWKDVLAVVYAGQNHTSAASFLQTTFPKTRNPARVNCASPVRKALADNWGAFFNTNCAATGNPANCLKLKHAYRRGDLSGTTDTFVTLVGILNAVPAYSTKFLAQPIGQIIVDTTSATSNPFCNAGTAAMNKGDSDYLDLDPIRRIADSSSPGTRFGIEQVAEGHGTPANQPPTLGTDVRADPAAATALVELAEFGAGSRQNVGPNANITAPAPNDFQTLQHNALLARKGLGLVLPVEIPTNYSDFATAYWGPATDPANAMAPITVCTPGQFALSTPVAAQGTATTICPDGTSGTCLFPVNVSCSDGSAPNLGSIPPSCTAPATVKLNYNCMVDRTTPTRPALTDGRFFNQFVVDPVAGHYRLDGFTDPLVTAVPAAKVNRVVSAFFRLNVTQTNNFGGPIPAPNGFTVATPGATPLVGNVCKNFTSTDQIGCLVQANPCSIGFAGREAVAKAPALINDLAYRLGVAQADSRPPTDTTILELLDTSATAPFYPMARKLFVNHWVDPALPVLPTMAKEDVLYNCFKQDTITTPRITQFHFLGVPSGPRVDNACPNNR